MCAVVVGWTWHMARRSLLTTIACAATPVLAGGFALALRYGSPLPNSIAAKQVAYQAPAAFENALALLVQAGLPGWSTYQLSAWTASVTLVIATLALATLAFLIWRGTRRLSVERVPWPPFGAFATLYLAFYVLAGLRGVRLFPWYLVPIEPFYLLGAAAGLANLGHVGRAWIPALLFVWQLPAIDWRQPFQSVGFDRERETALFDVGLGLARSLPANAVVAAPEIGALGYASNLRILDTVGLVSPASLRYYPLPADQLEVDNAIPAQLISDERPDMVVTLDAFAERSLLVDPKFQREYRLERVYQADVWRSSRLLLYRRVAAVANGR
jgi:hypothetical protein